MLFRSCGLLESKEATRYALAGISKASPSRFRSRPSIRFTGSAERKKKMGATRKPPLIWLARRTALPQAFATEQALAPTIFVGGAWTPLGPASTVGGQVTVPPNNTIGGAIQALAIHPTNPDIIYIGAVNGGVWRTANATAPSPTWIPLTDSQEIGRAHV